MTKLEAPRGVVFLQEALAERMGRPAAIRVVKGNTSKWYISDPSFSVIQRGTGSNPRGYRSGILVDNDEIGFHNVHSRTPALLLRKIFYSGQKLCFLLPSEHATLGDIIIYTSLLALRVALLAERSGLTQLEL